AALAALVGWRLTRGGAPEVTTAVARESEAGGGTVLNASGYVTARRQATVSSKVTGKVEEVLIEEGMHVERGQVLARLDTSNVEVNLRLAEAQLATARASVEETKVRLVEAELTLGRNERLVEREVASQAELDRARAEADSLKARLQVQQDEIEVAHRQIALWRQEQEDRIIRAPFDGVVVAKNAQPGEMISPISAGGGFTRTGIGTVVDMSSLEIEVDVNEAYINRVQPGQPVEAILDAYPDWRIPAQVIAIIPTADRQRATVEVRVGFDRLDPRILPDMGVKVAFRNEAEAGATRSAVTIPQQALRKLNGQDAVFVYHDGRVERRAVTVGSSTGPVVEIAAGLAAGEKVVLEGPQDLQDGDSVKEASR
ncbi:MAG TPA: efflux RND transporter periplasmic adaptor subunit, partial [Acidobacteriota bacterium]